MELYFWITLACFVFDGAILGFSLTRRFIYLLIAVMIARRGGVEVRKREDEKGSKYISFHDKDGNMI
jgi:hypothetical protein